MSIPDHLIPPTESELQAAEAAIGDAIMRRDTTDLRVLGFGEISVAVGWPTADPTVVLKRSVAFGDRANCQYGMNAIAEYLALLEADGMDVLPTSTHVIERPDGRFIGYAAQPFVPRELLAETVLEEEDPRPDHPLVMAVRDCAVRHVSEALSMDLQFTNFAWDGDRLVLLDVTTPIVFTPAGDYAYEIKPELFAVMPAPMRGLALKEVESVLTQYQTLPDALTLVLSLLYRIGQQRWVPTVADSFNAVLDKPIDVTAVEREFARLTRVIPLIKRSCQVQRWWVTKIRRGSYDAFITDSFTGELL